MQYMQINKQYSIICSNNAFQDACWIFFLSSIFHFSTFQGIQSSPNFGLRSLVFPAHLFKA